VIQLAEGLSKKIIKVGEQGRSCPPKGCPVKVQYEGRLTDGSVFDSSHGQSPLDIKIGEGQVIKGWDVGVMSMHLGEMADLTCSPDFAYGESGSPPKIPANATLIFRVELVEQDGEKMSEIPDEEIVKIAEGQKALGNEAVKAKDYEKATFHYSNALNGL